MLKRPFLVLLLCIGAVELSTAQNGTMGGFDPSVLFKILSGDYSAVPTLLVNTLKGMITGDGACSHDMRYYFDSLSNMEMWALKLLDASGKPQRNILQGSVTWLGAYDDCREIRYYVPSTQSGAHGYHIDGGYLKITISLPANITSVVTADLGMAAGGMLGSMFNLRWDVCIPNSCKLVNMTQALNTPQTKSLGVNIVSGIFQEPSSMDEDASAYVSLVIIGLLLAMCVIGTGLDIVQQRYDIESKCKKEEINQKQIKNPFVNDKQNDTNSVINGSLTREKQNGTNGLVNGINAHDKENGGNDLVNGDNVHDKQNGTNGLVNGDNTHIVVVTSETDLSEKNDLPLPTISMISNGTNNETVYDNSPVDTKNSVPVETKTAKKKVGLCEGILLAFSIRRNGKKILDCSSPPGSLSCLHGIRVLSMTWVILGHYIGDVVQRVENKKDLNALTKTYWFQAVINGTLSVDTFFLLSGLLVSYLFIREVSKTRKITLKQMGLFYFHRFWRLTPLYMFVLMIYANLTKYMYDGPLYDKPLIDRAVNDCKDYWWRNFLYINNLYKDSIYHMCMGWSWYLANDMQFYIVSPLAIIPLALGYKVIGLLVVGGMFVTHLATSGYYDWEVGRPGINAMGAPNGFEYFDKVYFKPYARVGVYAVGLLLGYILHRTKNVKILPKVFVVLGSCAAIIIGILCTYVTYDYAKEGGEPWSNDSLIAFDTLFRPGWAIAVSFLIFICVRGYGGFVNDILSWGAWIPLSRLTYAAYLIHLIIISIDRLNMRGLEYMTILYLANGFISTVALSYAVSFILSVIVEAPLLGLEKHLIKK